MKRNRFPVLLRSFVLIAALFSLAFLYLHQKVLCFVQAYELSESQRYLSELNDKKDFLIYNISQEVSLARLNQWSDENQFVLADKDKIVALNLRGPVQELPENRFASLFNRFISKIPDAVAQNQP